MELINLISYDPRLGLAIIAIVAIQILATWLIWDSLGLIRN